MSERMYKKDPESLRSQERLQLLEIERVIKLCLEGIYITKVLDVGCGTGIFSEAFRMRHLEVSGVDINPEMVRNASAVVEGVKFHEAPAEALPFEDDSFDLVFMGHLLHESDDPLLALKEARRVGTKRLAVLEWPYRNEEIGPPLKHRIEPKRMESMMTEAGFVDIETHSLAHVTLYRCTIPAEDKGRKKESLITRA